ncbi:MAG TPA: tripartite tricarboxylate transporter substrate-binding protein [Bradyrhizobium sp.]
MRVWQGIIAAALLVGGVAPSWAEGYPTRPVRVVVGFPAGGPTDVIARLLAQKLSDSLGQQFVVENIPGAGGNLASGQAARANADGYTIMAISTGFVVNPSLYAKVPYDPIKDFAPVSLVTRFPQLLVVKPELPAKTVSELVALAKSDPGKLTFGSSGIGGAAPAVQATIGGHTPIAFTALPSSMSAIRAGQVRAIGIAARERSAQLPDVPTFAEEGVKDQEADTLTGIVAPAATPKEIVALLAREIAKGVGTADVKQRLATLGFRPVANTPDEFAARIKVEIDKWGKVVRDANLKIE